MNGCLSTELKLGVVNPESQYKSYSIYIYIYIHIVTKIHIQIHEMTIAY